MTPHKCPVCLGTTNVPGGFYQCCPGGTAMSCNVTEKCQACVNGVVWEYDSIVITPGTSSGGGQNCSFEWKQLDLTLKEEKKVAKTTELHKIYNLLEKIVKLIKGQERHV